MVRVMVENDRITRAWGPITVAGPLLFAALAHGLSGRFTQAARFVRSVEKTSDAAATALADSVVEGLRGLKVGIKCGPRFRAALNRPKAVGYGGYARVVEAAVAGALGNRPAFDSPKLTDAERAILDTLAAGLSPKEIALESGRSVHTVRAHIQNAIGKLGCHGHHEAIRLARERGLIGIGVGPKTF